MRKKFLNSKLFWRTFVYSFVVFILMLSVLYYIFDESVKLVLSLILLVPAVVTIYLSLRILKSHNPYSIFWKTPLIFLLGCLVLWSIVFILYYLSPGGGLGAMIAFALVYAYAVLGMLVIFVFLVFFYIKKMKKINIRLKLKYRYSLIGFLVGLFLPPVIFIIIEFVTNTDYRVLNRLENFLFFSLFYGSALGWGLFFDGYLLGILKAIKSKGYKPLLVLSIIIVLSLSTLLVLSLL